MNEWKPRFKTLYIGKWEHSADSGVGLKFTNFPSSVAEFVEIVGGFGCHPRAAVRILYRILERNYDLLTVIASLDFDLLAQELARIEVQVEIIPPEPNWKPKYQDGPWYNPPLTKYR